MPPFLISFNDVYSLRSSNADIVLDPDGLTSVPFTYPQVPTTQMIKVNYYTIL